MHSASTLTARLAPVPAALVLAVLLLLTACGDGPPDPASSFDEASQRLYVIELDGEAAGVVEERRGRAGNGAPRMDTRVEIHLPGSGWLLREERLQFATESPHVLLQRTRFTRTPAGIEHHEVASGEDLGSPDLQTLEGTRALATAPVGERIEQLGMFGAGEHSSMTTAWEVKSRDPDGTHALGERTDGAKVGLWLAPDGTPMRYVIGDSFVLRRVHSRPTLQVARNSGPLLLPVPERLGDSAKVSGMTLRVHGPAAGMFRSGPGLQAGDGSEAILVTKRLGPEPWLEPRQRSELQRLVAEVRQRIRYHPGAAPPSLDALLSDGRGDCYEFAALFSALATAAGYDSRVVTGLAWAGDELGGFAPHAWNEVRIDGHWLSIDPTWDQLGADATRLRFPDDPGMQLDLQVALTRSSLEIVDITLAGQ
ncbi:MAG: transglutaminase domain-containing protein [Gammaproteobacteria bacterium]|nr:transglutaminase domain-containing protein [Gammaproteobacteria bacterium]